MAKATLRPVNIEATTLPDSWFQIIWNLLDHGREFVIGHGSYAGQKRLELDYVDLEVRALLLGPGVAAPRIVATGLRLGE